MQVILTATLIAHTAAAAVGTPETRRFETAGLTKLKVKTGSGKVQVRARSVRVATVTAIRRVFSEDCTLTMERVGDTLRVESQKAPHVWRSNCRVDFEIVVPSKIDVSLKSGSGDASIDGMQGRVSIRIGSGDVSVKGRILGVEARSGNGDIEVQGVVGDARIRMGSGKCELHYDEVPTRGTVEIRAGSGSATIHVPSSAKLQASLRAGSGRLYRDLPDTPDAEFKIAMRAGSGNLYLKRR